MDSGRITDRQGPHASEGVNGERSGRDRRAKRRRAPQRPIDPLFAMTLVNHVAPDATEYTRGYPEKKPPCGILVNKSA
jgi:hypothetical protein